MMNCTICNATNTTANCNGRRKRKRQRADGGTDILHSTNGSSCGNVTIDSGNKDYDNNNNINMLLDPSTLLLPSTHVSIQLRMKRLQKIDTSMLDYHYCTGPTTRCTTSRWIPFMRTNNIISRGAVNLLRLLLHLSTVAVLVLTSTTATATKSAGRRNSWYYKRHQAFVSQQYHHHSHHIPHIHHHSLQLSSPAAFAVHQHRRRTLQKRQQFDRLATFPILLLLGNKLETIDNNNGDEDSCDHDSPPKGWIQPISNNSNSITSTTNTPPSSSTTMTSTTASLEELLQTIIVQQQQQMDALVHLLKIQQQQQQSSSFVKDPILTTTKSFDNTAVIQSLSINGEQQQGYNNTAPQLFQPLAQIPKTNSPITNNNNNNNNDNSYLSIPKQEKLKVMLFIDGTWLYYSIYERLAKDITMMNHYGRGWLHRYDVDWEKLPSLLCNVLRTNLVMLNNNRTASMTTVNATAQQVLLSSVLTSDVELEFVRSMVYTSYKADTSTTSYRYRLFQNLQRANYQVHMMETIGKSEKCVDIQLAVEILHYATNTVENHDSTSQETDTYDIALLLTGDKDLMPAIIRTRCKGKQVGLVSMRSGCNRALIETPSLLNFDIIWIEDLLDQLLIPRTTEIDDAQDSSRGMLTGVSLYTLHKVVHDFIRYSCVPQVSSRDLGRYLKQLRVNGPNSSTLLDTMKSYFGGMHQYLTSMGYYNCSLPPVEPGRTDYSYLVSLSLSLQSDKSYGTDLNVDYDDDIWNDGIFYSDPLSIPRLTEIEKQFFKTYSIEPLVQDRDTLYRHSIERASREVSKRRDVPTPTKNEDSISIVSIQKVINDFIIQSGCDRVLSTDLSNYLQHIRVSHTHSLLDEIDQVHGDCFTFLSDMACYNIVGSNSNALDFSRSPYWIALNSNKGIDDGNLGTHLSEAERKFFMRYTIEPLLISRRRWYCNTLSAESETKSVRYPSLSVYQDMKAAELKLLCRDMGLPVSGTKSVLVERIQTFLSDENAGNYDKLDCGGEAIEVSTIPETTNYDASSTSRYLRDLIEEYLHAKGGVASSRMVGRYLAANKAINKNKKNALGELKATYGSLNTFVSQNLDAFDIQKEYSKRNNNDNDVIDAVNGSYEFNVALRKKTF